MKVKRHQNSEPPNLNTGAADKQSVDFHDSGWIFDIQKFSLHDGPGIRDLVFMKGCPLRCRWCSNPESQLPHPEIFFRVDRCLGVETCGLCKAACPLGAIDTEAGGRATIDWFICNQCGRCATVCPSKAIELVGQEVTVAQILKVVERDAGFHFRSGGGVTVSGGEPLAQADFVASLLGACRMRGIDTAVETAGHGSWEKMEKIGRHANLMFFDIKSMDTAKHKTFTGVSNLVILENLRHFAAGFPRTPIVVRTPVIPGFNDTRKDILDIVAFLERIETLKGFELLPYHRFGLSKYVYLGRSCMYAQIEPPSESCLRELRQVAGRIKEGMARQQKSIADPP